jgi:hypothetical protein
MAVETVPVADFDFSGFYYQQILEALLNYKRRNAPELTDESDFEASMQFLKAFALVGHMNNVILDVVANEVFFTTAKLAESVRDSLRLIGYEMKSSTPSSVDLLFKLSKVFATSFALIPNNSRAATVADDSGSPTIFFETTTGLTIDRTDQMGRFFYATDDVGSLVFTDLTAAMNAGTGSSFGFLAGDHFYIGHSTVMWDRIDFTIAAVCAVSLGVWEFYDGNFEDERPDVVSDLGGGRILLELTSLLGPSKRTGARVRVRLSANTTFEDATSEWDGSKNVVEVGLLGQSSPSLDVQSYVVGADWKELDSVADSTGLFDATGSVTFSLPQNESLNWKKTTVNGFEGFFLRFRCIEVLAVTSLDIDRVRIDQGKQYAIVNAAQGRSVIGETLGSSNAAPSQSFVVAQTNFIVGSEEVRVAGVPWTRVDNFLDSESASEHYRVELIESDKARVIFGDGALGKIPPVGVGNITIDYRFGAQDNGNVGANTITVDKQSLSFVETITNPRRATGWAASQASDATTLERSKAEGVASIRNRDVALGPEDAEELAVAFVDSNGARPFGRAKAIEEGFGPKTVEVVCVARGGGQATQPQLDELTVYFNGDKLASPPKKKHFVTNQQATATNFTARGINLEIIVTGPSDLDLALVKATMEAFLDPEATETDGVTFCWDFGDLVDKDRLKAEVFTVDPRIRSVSMPLPASSVQLGIRELPDIASLKISLVSV